LARFDTGNAPGTGFQSIDSDSGFAHQAVHLKDNRAVMARDGDTFEPLGQACGVIR
jgi:hypothetical protein